MLPVMSGDGAGSSSGIRSMQGKPLAQTMLPPPERNEIKPDDGDSAPASVYSDEHKPE